MRNAPPYCLEYTGHQPMYEVRYASMKEAQAELTDALKAMLAAAKRKRGWHRAKIHRYQHSGEVLAGPDRHCSLWGGIAIVPI